MVSDEKYDSQRVAAKQFNSRFKTRALQWRCCGVANDNARAADDVTEAQRIVNRAEVDKRFPRMDYVFTAVSDLHSLKRDVNTKIDISLLIKRF